MGHAIAVERHVRGRDQGDREPLDRRPVLVDQRLRLGPHLRDESRSGVASIQCHGHFGRQRIEIPRPFGRENASDTERNHSAEPVLVKQVSTLDRLWFAMVTRNRDRSGTDSPIGLVLNVNGVDRLNHLFRVDTLQKDQERGQANLYRLDVSRAGIDEDQLDGSYVRVGVSGADSWQPETICVWGERSVRLSDPEVAPIAFETSIEVRLTNRPNEGFPTEGSINELLGVAEPPPLVVVPSMPVRRAVRGDASTTITQVILIVETIGVRDEGFFGSVTTKDVAEAGTDDALELEIVNADGTVLRQQIPDTPQDDLENGQANIYFLSASIPFNRRSLRSESVTLRILGDDAWFPRRLFLFGLDGDAPPGRPLAIVPLVYLPEWSLGRLSTDSNEGKSEIHLPTLGQRDFDDAPGGGVVADQ